ncbi:MAG: hypothetical protein Q7U51_06330, partial [Methanoregula sp.]|nr:hypothetical protein [Methanoregula sp.]
RYFAKPDPTKAGVLIAGADPMRVALKRQELIAALIGPEGEGEMRPPYCSDDVCHWGLHNQLPCIRKEIVRKILRIKL